MATATIDMTAHAPVAEDGASARSHPLMAGILTMVGAIALVWALVAVLVMVITDTPVVGAIGVGAYVAFFIGGGFGAIFTSASAFEGQH